MAEYGWNSYTGSINKYVTNMKKCIGLLLLFLCFGFCSCSFQADKSKVIVHKILVRTVIDGDTIELSDGEKVRYIGINTPERNQKYYKEARDLNMALVQGKDVTIEYDALKKDQYGRTLGYVFVDSVLVNQEIIKAGLAFVYSEHSTIKHFDAFLRTEKEAKEKHIGIWTKSNAKIKINTVHFNAQGKDEEYVNGEWIDLVNTGAQDMSISGFALQDESNNQFIFPNYSLGPRSSVRIYSGKGRNTREALYWGSLHPIWNNDGDTVFLFDNKNQFIESKTYP